MEIGQRVLVVDGLTETEEVLKAILEPKGFTVDRVRGRAAQQLDGIDHPPSVVVIHRSSRDGESTHADHWPRIPRVIIGGKRRGSVDGPSPHPVEHHLPKPFQYGELLAAIECCLGRAMETNG